MSSCRILLAASLLVLPLVPGCTSDAERREAHLERAEQYAEEGKDREALLELRSALRLQPNDVQTNFRIAQVLEGQGRLGDAAFYYRETTRLDPTHSEAALAEAFLLLGEEPERSEELIEGVLAREPENVLAHVRRAELALVRVDTEGALSAALTAREIEPENPLPHMELGIVYKAMISEARQRREEIDPELYPKAIAAFERGAELAEPDDRATAVRAQLERAEVLSVWPEHTEEAATAYREAAEYALEHLERAETLVALQAAGEFARGRDAELERWTLERIVELEPDRMRVWERLARVVEDADGDPETVWKQLLERAPDDADAHIRYADDLARRDLHPQAIAHLDAQLERADEPGKVGAALVQLLISRGRVQDARLALERLDRTHPEAPGRDLAAAFVALAEQRFDDALELARAEVEREESANAQHIIAEAELRRGDTQAAVAAAERALELSARRPSVALMRTRARVALAAQDWTTAIRFLRRARVASRRSLGDRDRTDLARALYGAGQPEQGRELLEPMLERENPWAPAVFLFAALEGRRDPDATRALLTRVLEQRPQDVQLRFALARLEILQGNEGAARRQLDVAVEASPNSAALLAARAQFQLKQGQLDAAEADARRALELDAELGAASEILARVLALSGRAGQAVAELEKSEADGKLGTSGRVLLALLLFKLGEVDRAAPVYEKLHAERPDLPGVKNNYALVLIRQGRELDRALQLAREAQQLDPESPAAADTLGVAYMVKGLHGPARDQLGFAASLAEKQGIELPAIQYHLGLALKGLDRPDEAAAAFERALASREEFPEAEEARRELEALRAEASAAAGPS